MNIGLIVVGDEILSGKRQDKHFVKVIEILKVRGLQLSWVHYVGDDRAAQTMLYQRSFASSDLVFSCGGIGATPDDHTRYAVAQALGRRLLLHPEAAELIAGRVAEMAAQGQGNADMTRPENQQRLRMGEFPEGAGLIPNPFNRIPGFQIENHWFVPGFPVMAWPMIEWVLDQHYSHLFHAVALGELSVIVNGIGESDAAELLEQIEARFPGVKVFSLPTAEKEGKRGSIEMGVKGDIRQLEVAFNRLKQGLVDIGAKV